MTQGGYDMPEEQCWTMASYVAHNEEMRRMHDQLAEERDRRYTEVNRERERAMHIKETADLAALSLAREGQVYKDERNDVLREQNLKEAGVYATRADLELVVQRLETTIKPLVEYVNAQQGVVRGSTITKGSIVSMITTAATVLTIMFLISEKIL